MYLPRYNVNRQFPETNAVVQVTRQPIFLHESRTTITDELARSVREGASIKADIWHCRRSGSRSRWRLSPENGEADRQRSSARTLLSLRDSRSSNTHNAVNDYRTECPPTTYVQISASSNRCHEPARAKCQSLVNPPLLSPITDRFIDRRGQELCSLRSFCVPGFARFNFLISRNSLFCIFVQMFELWRNRAVVRSYIEWRGWITTVVRKSRGAQWHSRY